MKTECEHCLKVGNELDEYMRHINIKLAEDYGYDSIIYLKCIRGDSPIWISP